LSGTRFVNFAGIEQNLLLGRILSRNCCWEGYRFVIWQGSRICEEWSWLEGAEQDEEDDDDGDDVIGNGG
jgi:hypothetical protein